MDRANRSLSNPLQYENRLRFPDEMESAYRIDFANRAINMQRHFIAFGFILYGLFGILDYYAMPRTYQTACILRALLELFVALFFLATFEGFGSNICTG